MSGVTYAMIVAVENYNEPSDFPKVNYAKKDSEDLTEALKGLGYEDEDFIVLVDEKATKAAITQKLKKVCERALPQDRIMFYFAGHGFYENDQNLLAGADAIKTAKIDTCVPINTLLGFLKKSQARQKILFIDCCHSGFEAGEYEREGIDSFSSDELIYQFSREEFCVGFASCKSNETSVSHPKLQNGVWTHYLIQALKGEVAELYTKGLLFSDKLQSFLNKRTSEFVKKNTVKKKDQTPIKFGSETDKFIIADLNPLFEERARSRQISDLSFVNISLLSEEIDLVKNLPGFQKGYHKVPTNRTSATENFIKDKGAEIIQNEVNDLSIEIRERLGYKRTEISSNIDTGVGSIETPDFDYSIEIRQSDSDPTKYVVVRTLENVANSDVTMGEKFNEIFSMHFDRLVFRLPKAVNIESLIDKIEGIEDSTIQVKYNPANPQSCRILIDGFSHEILVNDDRISIATNFQTSPERLIGAFKATRKVIMSNPELRILE